MDNGIIPDVVDVEASNSIDVSWGNNVKAEGKELKPVQVKDPPLVKWPTEKNKYYTLIMADPDAPSREDPKFREWRHWTIINIPEGNIEKGNEIVQYVGAGPPKGTGLHRYVILVYEQVNFIDPSGFKWLTNKSGEDRANFSTKEFARKNEMAELVGCTYFLAQWDDYVPKLYEQLKG